MTLNARRSTLRAVTAMAVAGLVALPAAGSASAATFAKDRVQLVLAPKFKKALRKGKVKVHATGGASLAGSTLTLPIASGSATLAAPIDGSLTLTGGLELKRKKHFNLTGLSEVLNGSSAVLRRGATGYFSQATAGTLAPSADFTELDATGMPAKLTAKGAKTLDAKLKVKVFKKNQTVGKVSFTALRQLAVTGGSTHLEFDQGTKSKLASCGITLTPIAPTTATGTGLDMPISGGQLDAKTLFGTIDQAGGIHLQSSKQSTDLTTIQESLSASGATATAFVSAVNSRAAFADVDLSHATFSKSLTATTGSMSANGPVLRVNSATQLLLQLNGCNSVHAGDPIGTATISANVQ